MKLGYDFDVRCGWSYGFAPTLAGLASNVAPLQKWT